MSAIEWTDVTWNPVTGCKKISPGCANCYAEGIAKRFWKGRAFTDVQCHADRLAQPLRWRKPRRVFVNSMSDLFHEDVPFEFIAAVFGVMAAAPAHTFQVLTKRPGRMLAFFEWAESLPSAAGRPGRDGAPVVGYLGEYAIRATEGKVNVFRHGAFPPWPLPNVWLGVSVEDQDTAKERLPLLHAAPARIRFVSYEPALGPVHWNSGVYRMADGRDYGTRISDGKIDWMIVGGESGHGARPCNVEWIRSAVGQCRAFGVPCFVKQLGANSIWYPGDDVTGYEGIPQTSEGSAKRGDPDDWPADLRVREYPAALDVPGRNR